MKSLHTASAAIELGAGLALLCFPSAAVMLLLGEPLPTAATSLVARVGGAGLLALGIACWMSRNDTGTCAARGVITAMLVYDIAAAAILAFAGIGHGLNGPLLWPAVVMHSVMTIWCIQSLRVENCPPAK